MEQPIEKEIFSTKQTLRLRELTVQSYAGISHEHDLFITFPEDKNITGFVGNNGVGKTSALRAILTLLGYEEPANAVNATDKTKKAVMKFVKDGDTYTVNQTKTSFSITVERADGQKSELKSPKDAITKLVGNVSMSPMAFKEMSGKNQIAEMRKMLKWSPESQKAEENIKSMRKSAYDARTETNRIASQLRNDLTATGLFAWSKENQQLEATVQLLKEYDYLKDAVTDEAAIKEAFSKADKARDLYLRAVQRVDDLKVQKAGQERENERIANEIARLQASLASGQHQLTTIEENIAKGQQFVSDNAGAEEAFRKAQEDMMNFGAIQKRKDTVTDTESKKELHDQAVQNSVDYTTAIDEADIAMKELVASLTPAIPGLELELGGSIDNPRAEGIYYNGRSMAECCETEMWEWFVPFLQQTNTGVVIVENVTSLGSKAVDVLNSCAKNGMYVFYSAMQREENKLKIEFHSELQ